MPEQPAVEPVMMLRSFLTVGSGYMLHIMIFFGIALALGYGFFPEFAAYMDLPAEQQKDLNIADAIPRAMFLILVVLHSIACLGIGWYVHRTAPFSPFPHAIFLTILLFLTYLQMAMGDPPEKKAMSIIYMIAFPISVLTGAKIMENRSWKNEPDTAQPNDAEQ